MSIFLFSFNLLVFIGIFLVLFKRTSSNFNTRDAFLFGVVALGVVLVLITEILSLFHLLNRRALGLSWIVVILISFLFLLILMRWKSITRFSLSAAKLKLARSWPEFSRFEILVWALIGGQIFTLGVVAYLYTPYHYDSMTYHLPRVMHWAQNHTVAHYATNIDRQIQMPPFAEYIMLHMQILDNSDRFVNLVQWFAMLSSVIGVTNIAAKLGANRVQQGISALLCAFIPMGILQSTSTQNDYVVSLSIIIFVSFLISLLRDPTNKLFVAGVGMAFGLALLTKGTGYIYTIAIAIVLIGYYIYCYRAKVIRTAAAIMVITVALNAGHYLRNYALYRSPLGPSSSYRNEIFTPGVLLSNTIRNIAIHVPIKTGIGAIDLVDLYLMSWLRLIHQLSGLGPTDGRTSLSTAQDVFQPYNPDYQNDQDYSGNPLHMLLLVAAIGATLLNPVYWRYFRYLWLVVLSIFLSFLLFSFYLKWQIWGSRLQLPLFVLGTAIVPLILFKSQKSAVLAIPILVALFGFNWTFNNSARPISLSALYDLYPRPLGYLMNIEEYQNYKAMTQMIAKANCKDVGLAVGLDSWEYPIWTMFKDHNFSPRIEHIYVSNATAILQPVDFNPCAVIAEGTNPLLDDQYIFFPFSPYNLYISTDLELDPPKENPEGFIISSDLAVVLGQGWYNFEQPMQVRWMQGKGTFLIYTDKKTRAMISFKPFLMHQNGGFSIEGKLQVKVRSAAEPYVIPVYTDQVSTIEVELKRGFNPVALTLEAGDFIPGNGETRSLGIAFYPIEIRSVPDASSK